jgi:pimeloyl-ACP methyl ester carboxylesterase
MDKKAVRNLKRNLKMNTQLVGYKVKVFGAGKLAFFFLVILLLLPACARQPQPARIEEITFKSGSFHIVGDLRLPAGKAPFPVVLFVHGYGPIDRTSFGAYLPIMERMLRLGYAVFSWDKPGTGESTGQLSDERVYHQRAQIILDAIEVMKKHPDIDPGQIGLWGSSQGGYVMPLALSQTKDIAFMICVSCAGVAGDDQMAYQIISQAICDGVPEEKDAELKHLLVELDEARTFETYEEYVHYREVLSALGEIGSDTTTGFKVPEVIPKEAWQANDPEVENWWNPVRVIEQVRIPVLVINGDKDTNIDPIQGAYAWRKALEQAGNPNFQVEILLGVNHFMLVSESSCIDKQMQTFDQVLQDQGYGPMNESLELFLQEPGQHTPLSAIPNASEYLDKQDEWLRNLILYFNK